MDISFLQRQVKPADMPLERLAASSQISDKAKVAEVSRQFEAILLRQILSEAQKTVFKSKANPQNSTTGIYKDMITNQMADKISQSGAFGLARSLSQQLGHELKAEQAKTVSPAVGEPPKTL
jgi:Rod binding domain-containing protein